MRLGQQQVKIRERAEGRVNGAIIGDIIAEIPHRGFEEWRDPDGIDAERRHIAKI